MSILVCGEALYDLFQLADSEERELTFQAQPGGSPFNVASALARLGGDAALLTGLSTDALGARLFDRLAEDGVDTRYIVRNGRRTTLSVVGLDQMGSPDYAFYGIGSADCALTKEDLPPIGQEIRALHFGSYSLVVQPLANALASLAEQHKDLFISLDPNVRPTIEPDMAEWQLRIDAMRPHANLIKVSVEDLNLLLPDRNPEDVARGWAAENPCIVALTDGANEFVAFRGGESVRVQPPDVDVIDTVGAGDAVQASLLADLQRLGALEASTTEPSAAELQGMLERAALVGARTCEVRGARIPQGLGL